MKIEILGCRCINCYKYTQYYRRNYSGEMEAVDCGYCGIHQRNVRPGDRCKEYFERSNAGK